MLQRADQQRPPFDAVLKRGLERQRDPGGKDCPDEATFAAYCDRSLPPSESARWEGHFSNCARCQGILAAIARAQTAARVALPHTRWRRWQPYAALAAGVAGISIALNLMLTGRHQRVPAAFSVRNEIAASVTVRQAGATWNRNDRSADRTERTRAASNPGDQRTISAESCYRGA